MVLELLQQHVFEVDSIFATESFLRTHPQIEKFHPKKTITASREELGKLSALSTPSEVLAVVESPPTSKPPTDWEGWSLYLDDIRNPGNLGTIWRIADWFGWPCVFCSPECVDAYNPKVLQASMGAFLRVPVYVLTIEEIKEMHPSKSIWGADARGNNVFADSPGEGGVLAIGNESKGLSERVRTVCQGLLAIPGGKGGAESLNAAIATGILCAQLSQSRTDP
ncbi:MAG: RNA methyltransferase [Bacteroidota bacterium]